MKVLFIFTFLQKHDGISSNHAGVSAFSQERLLGAHGNLVAGPCPPQQKRRVLIVPFIVFQGEAVILISVAVTAAVDACIVSPYVTALDTVTALSHAPVTELPEIQAIGVTEDLQSHTSRRVYPEV